MKNLMTKKTKLLSQKPVGLLQGQDLLKLSINLIKKGKNREKLKRKNLKKKDQGIQNLFKPQNKQQNLFKLKKMKLK